MNHFFQSKFSFTNIYVHLASAKKAFISEELKINPFFLLLINLENPDSDNLFTFLILIIILQSEKLQSTMYYACVHSVTSAFWLSGNLCAVGAHQAPLSMAFSRQEYWSGLPCPPPGDLSDPGIEPTSHVSCIGGQAL